MAQFAAHDTQGLPFDWIQAWLVVNRTTWLTASPSNIHLIFHTPPNHHTTQHLYGNSSNWNKIAYWVNDAVISSARVADGSANTSQATPKINPRNYPLIITLEETAKEQEDEEEVKRPLIPQDDHVQCTLATMQRDPAGAGHARTVAETIVQLINCFAEPNVLKTVVSAGFSCNPYSNIHLSYSGPLE
jgi:hypothetical protein